MKNHRIRSFIFIFFILGLLFCQGPSFSQTKTPKTVAILPFTMNADRDLSFLREGIMDMMGSRLAWKGEVKVIQKGIVNRAVNRFEGPINRESALDIGKALKVDYVILGSLTVFGDSISIDARILDVAKSEELMTAFNQTRGMDAVIPTINQFAQDINEKIMGRIIQPKLHAAAPSAVPKGPGGLAAPDDDFEGREVGLSQRFRFEIKSLAAGDVDGDGKNEAIFITSRQIYIYRLNGTRFMQAQVFKEGWSPQYIYGDAIDLDGNGKAEMYVTNLDENNVSSYVYEWAGGQFRQIAAAPGWFLRVAELPGKGPTVIGQRRRTGRAFHGKVQIMKREGDRFTPTEILKLPRFWNIYNFA
ncbi:MAG: VCBS repeat-containing protein, partial [Deltaproteobacteria bacterium]|nr:VCBS repeat-containing protein [Deltaproteobacteria bacterium]